MIRRDLFGIGVGVLCAGGWPLAALGQVTRSAPAEDAARPGLIATAPISFDEPLAAAQGTVAATGQAVALPLQRSWRFTCGTDTRGRTVDDLRAIALVHEAKIADPTRPRIVVDTPRGGGGFGGRAGPINIVYVLDGTVPAAAVPAFQRAEQYIESKFFDPITVTVTVTFDALGAGILGSTGSTFTNTTYPTARTALQIGMDPTDTIQSFFPTGNFLPVRYTGDQATVTNEPFVYMTTANYRAVVGAITTTSDAAMSFSTNFAWDYDPTNGISGGTSFVDVVIHETGHALGFTSGADRTPAQVHALDLYRFARTNPATGGAWNPSTTAQFGTVARVVAFNVPNDDANSDIISAEYRMSDGSPYQASHFRQQNPVIGIMQPALSAGTTFYPNFFSAGDLAMLDAIGYDDVSACSAAPTITADPVSQSVCSNTSVTFSVTASGQALSYQWRKDGSNVANGTGATYTIANASPGNAGSYDCVVANPCGSATSNSATLTVTVAPIVIGQPASQTVCQGGGVTLFYSTTTGNPPATFQWKKNGVDIPGATANALTLNPAAPSDSGSYQCVLSHPCGTQTSNTATVTVNPVTSISTQPASQNVSPGGTATFTVVATGTGTLSYQWRKGGVNLTNGGAFAGATSASLTVSPVSAGDAGAYDCVVTGSCGDATSAAAQLTVGSACVADVDDGTGSGTPDGGVTVDDLLYYLGVFDAGLLRADVDDGSGTGVPDGGVTVDDLLYYLIRFDLGC